MWFMAISVDRGTISRRVIASCAGTLLVAGTLLPTPTPAQQDTPVTFSFDGALQFAGGLPRIRSLLISWNGDLVLERYFNGTNPDRVTNIKSASKSLLSALIGIAIEQGHITDVHQPIGDFFADRLNVGNERAKAEITVEDLLTMRSGLETTSNRNYGAWVLSPNWVSFALEQPLELPPGLVMEYSTGNTHLLSAILTQATGQSTLEFARHALAEPLGFRLAPWPRDPQGIFFGGNDMELTPRQMLQFGELYLNGGRTNGRQIVPKDWVESSLVRRAESTRERGRFYGYGWWSRDMAGHETPYAWGYGGQFILLVPALDLVVVTTSSANPGPERRNHTRRIYDLVEYEVVAVVSAALGYPGVSRLDDFDPDRF